jgi:predicted acylesterase/phospholipase RssA
MLIPQFSNARPVQVSTSPPATERTVAPGQVQPADSFQATSPSALRKIESAVVSLGTRVASVAHSVSTVAETALSLIPSLASMTAARAMAQLDGLKGGDKLSAVDWMKKHWPSTYVSDVNTLLKKVDGITESEVGLNSNDLVTVDKSIYQMLAPGKDANGVKTTPLFLRQLADASQNNPDAPYPAFVYIGENRQTQANDIMAMWNGPNRPSQNPFPTTDDRHTVWQALQDQAAKKDFPVFVDLDGNANTYDTNDILAKQTITSLWEKGDDSQTSPLKNAQYYNWMTTRLDSFYQTLDPWLAKSNPDLHKQIDDVKSKLLSPWLGAKDGIGPWPREDNVQSACDTMTKIAHGPAPALADTAISMDRDLLTGLQTNWMKFIREAGQDRRAQYFQPLAQSWVGLSLSNDPQVCPPSGPQLTAVSGTPPVSHTRSYDRALGLGEVIQHTLDSLGMVQRDQFMGDLKQQIMTQKPALEACEQTLRQKLGPTAYPGIDLDKVLAGKADADTLKTLAAQLDGPPSPTQSQAARYYGLLDFLVSGPSRYGNIHVGIDPSGPQFKNSPLAVSHFYNQREVPDAVSPLRSGPDQVETLGQQQPGAGGTNITMAFAGGGGKGFCYAKCLEGLRTALAANPGKFSIDEYTGNSAGALTAGMLAAGFKPDEVGTLMTQLDFTKFDSDAIPLDGGLNPQIGGADRNGMFSMQKMYTTFYDLLSKKLGVEGRPILFSDLPFKLNVTGTVLNTDLPADDPLRKLIDPDGRMVMSSTTTPNFDVVAAMTASAAVPGFFDSPQVQVVRGDKQYHIQFCDGGVTNNFPITNTQPAESMVVLPAHYAATDPTTGKSTTLSTLNFDSSNLGIIDQHNQQLYQSFAPQLANFLAKSGSERTVLAFNLSTQAEQALPFVQGKDAAATAKLVAAAQTDKLPELSTADGRKIVNAEVHTATTSNHAAAGVFAAYLEPPGSKQPMNWSLTHGQTYTPFTNEAGGIMDIVKAAGASDLSAIYRPFEQA